MNLVWSHAMDPSHFDDCRSGVSGSPPFLPPSSFFRARRFAPPATTTFPASSFSIVILLRQGSLASPAYVQAAFTGRLHTSLEVLALRQQISVLKRKYPRPTVNRFD